MPISRIRLFPDPILRQKAAPVTAFDPDLLRVIRKMERAMRRQPSGIGIAAPQIGIPLRVALVDLSARISDAERLVLVNPEILETRHPKGSREGCMSIPDYTGQLMRFDWIRLRCRNERGETREKTCAGIEAVCIQHEVDHLNGLLFLDHITSLKRDLIPRPRNG